MTRYRIDFDPDKIGLRVLLDAARYRCSLVFMSR
jgi:hypothetical protein